MSEPARSTARSGPARSGEALPSVTANLTWLRPGAVGGSENYVLSILAALAECAPQLDLRVVASSATLDAHSWLRERFAVRAVRLPGGRAGRFAREWALFQRRGLLRRRRGAVEPPAGVTHHLGGYEGGRLRARGTRRPAGRPAGTAVTVHDTQFLDLPRNFGAARRQFLARALGAALSEPNVVCVNSDFTGRRLAEHFDVDPARCFTVPPYVRAPDADSAPAGSAAPRYLLYPAVTWPHKRHDFLVDVAERLAERHRGEPAADLRFVLCGAPGPAHAAVMERIARSPAAGRFSHLGRVDAGRLAGLYRRAEALVFPSEYEGLGQPPLEAMAHGCPVLAGDHEALAETVGAGGEVLPPDADVWAAAVVGLAEPATRARLVDAGRARAAEFTPQRTAAAQLDAYRAAGPAR